MTDEEIREYAKKAILRACEIGNFYNYEEQDYSICSIEFPNGEIGFRVEKSTNVGIISVSYSPQAFLTTFVEVMDSQLKECNPSGAFAEIPLEVLSNMWDEKIGDIANVLVCVTIDELKSLDDLIGLSTLKIFEFVFSDDILQRSESKKRERINQILLEINEEKRNRILEMEKEYIESISAPQYVFCDVYDDQLEIWRKAKECYKQNKKYENPIEIVKLVFSDLDEDLIEQLADLDSYTAQAATIAREATARLLNVPDAISGRKLQRYLTESRKQRKQISDEEAENALSKYLQATVEREDFEEKIDKMIQNSISKFSQSDTEID